MVLIEDLAKRLHIDEFLEAKTLETLKVSQNTIKTFKTTPSNQVSLKKTY